MDVGLDGGLPLYIRLDGRQRANAAGAATVASVYGRARRSLRAASPTVLLAVGVLTAALGCGSSGTADHGSTPRTGGESAGSSGRGSGGGPSAAAGGSAGGGDAGGVVTGMGGGASGGSRGGTSVGGMAGGKAGAAGTAGAAGGAAGDAGTAGVAGSAGHGIGGVGPGGAAGGTGGTVGAGRGGTGGATAAWCLPITGQPMGIDWGKAVVDSRIRANPGLGWAYPDTLYLHGVYLAFKRLGDPSYLAYIKRWADAHMAGASPYNSLDSMQPTLVLDDMYRETKNAAYAPAPKAAATRLENSSYPTTSDGGFWHNTGLTGQLWGDGVFMDLPRSSTMASSSRTRRPSTSQSTSCWFTTSTWPRPTICTSTSGTRPRRRNPVASGAAPKVGTRCRC